MKINMNDLINQNLEKCFDTTPVISDDYLEATVTGSFIEINESYGSSTDMNKIINNLVKLIYINNERDFTIYINNNSDTTLSPVQEFNVKLGLQVRITPIVKRTIFEQGIIGD